MPISASSSARLFSRVRSPEPLKRQADIHNIQLKPLSHLLLVMKVNMFGTVSSHVVTELSQDLEMLCLP
jgi:hypothetical protein